MLGVRHVLHHLITAELELGVHLRDCLVQHLLVDLLLHLHRRFLQRHGLEPDEMRRLASRRQSRSDVALVLDALGFTADAGGPFGCHTVRLERLLHVLLGLLQPGSLLLRNLLEPVLVGVIVGAGLGVGLLVQVARGDQLRVHVQPHQRAVVGANDVGPLAKRSAGTRHRHFHVHIAAVDGEAPLAALHEPQHVPPALHAHAHVAVPAIAPRPHLHREALRRVQRHQLHGVRHGQGALGLGVEPHDTVAVLRLVGQPLARLQPHLDLHSLGDACWAVEATQTLRTAGQLALV